MLPNVISSIDVRAHMLASISNCPQTQTLPTGPAHAQVTKVKRKGLLTEQSLFSVIHLIHLLGYKIKKEKLV